MTADIIGEATPPAAVALLVEAVLWLESVAMRLFSLPFGVSIFVIAKKP